jgi:hypothetical protein
MFLNFNLSVVLIRFVDLKNAPAYYYTVWAFYLCIMLMQTKKLLELFIYFFLNIS